MMRKRESSSTTVSLLALDVALTASVFLGMVFFITFLFGADDMRTFLAKLYELLVEVMLPLSVEKKGEPSFGIFFYSTYFTSVWVWLYALAGLIAQVAEHAGLGFTRLKRLFDTDTQPILSLGAISTVLVTVVYVVSAPFALL